MNCKDAGGATEVKCLWHLSVQGKCCRPCCNGKRCGNLPACRDVEHKEFTCINKGWENAGN